LAQAGAAAVRIDTGYFFSSGSQAGMSGGTRASLAGAIVAPSFGYRQGRIVGERAAAKLRTFLVGGKERPAVTVGASENFALPRVAPQLREVNSYLGWFGGMSRPMPVTSLITKVPGTGALIDAVTSRVIKGSTGGPDAEERARSGSRVVAIAYEEGGAPLAEIHLEGVNGYTFTGEILAWGAMTAAAGGLQAPGALGPVDGFGLEVLEAGCAEAGIAAVASS
jgi:hypothetical protein